MTVDRCTVEDYLQILHDLEQFWGSDRTRSVHHPLFVREFGDSALVVREGARVVAYLFGFYSQTGRVAYVHLVAVRSGWRRHGLGRLLYHSFVEQARERGCTELKAITTPGNHASIEFHTGLGLHMVGEPNADGVPVIRDYSGPGEDRVVFRMLLSHAR